MTQYWLGLDCGGSWLKAGLYDREGREAGVQRLPLCALSPQPGWAERDMAELWQCCTGCHSRPAYPFRRQRGTNCRYRHLRAGKGLIST